MIIDFELINSKRGKEIINHLDALSKEIWDKKQQ